MKETEVANIFLVPVLDKWLLHSPLHHVTALINDAAARSLQDKGFRGELESIGHALAESAEPKPAPLEGDICPSFLGIIPTRGCNIGCVYCNFGGPTAELQHMDPKIAVAAVDWMAKTLHRHGKKDFRIHFFGGEPFVSPELVDIVTHRARLVSAPLGLVPYLDASTNGVFNESRCRMVGDYFGAIVLSFDGYREYHDRHRPTNGGKGTFDTVVRTAQRLSDMPAGLFLRVCITQESVSRMEEMTEWMCQEFRPEVVNFETLTPGALGARAGLQPPDPYEFARGCVGAYRVAAEHGVKAVYSAGDTERNRLSFCPVGTDALIVSIDGRVSGCYLLPEDWQRRGMDLDLGWVKPNGEMDLDFDAMTRVRHIPADKPRCRDCFCQWSCAGGCHVNQTYPNSDPGYTDFCIQTRIVTACLLLRDLGCEEMVDQLLDNPRALQRLGTHNKDTLEIELPNEAMLAAHPNRPTAPASSGRLRSTVAGDMALLG